MSFPLALCMTFALGAGVALAVQAPINAQLGKAVHSPLLASTISFSLSTLLLIATTLMSGEYRLLAGAEPLRWFLWIGGLFGPLYMLGVIFSVPVIGVVSTFAMVVAGQLLGAVIIDMIGAFGTAARPVSPARLLSVLFVFAGVVLSRF
ncbi:DMT family transporter [Pseudogemmobacter humi]|uniref:Inner membrane protein YdcZ n=1 Tax=Pseudogemmobacter humi TaxID=2483812 RepID=A0A3P5WTP7_9RHOB|nr:DMT family transporter [Pseudogemmobacter humi]VDC22671.1 hypothetical protein XINFAN_00845 [Pseudogemmobacter humi]